MLSKINLLDAINNIDLQRFLSNSDLNTTGLISGIKKLKSSDQNLIMDCSDSDYNKLETLGNVERIVRNDLMLDENFYVCRKSEGSFLMAVRIPLKIALASLLWCRESRRRRSSVGLLMKAVSTRIDGTP